MRKYNISVVAIVVLYIQFCSTAIATSITLAWQQNQEEDLAGYRVYWGTESLMYDESVFVGNTTNFEITELELGMRYYFAVTALDYWGNESALSAEVHGIAGATSPESYELALYPSVPNPFNPKTKIKYSVPERADIRLEITNALGQKVRTLFHGIQDAGLYQRFWDGTDDNGKVLSSGVYFCSLVLLNTQISKPMTFLH